MMRRDYILKMIEEFIRALARIKNQKEQQSWSDAELTIEAEARRLAGVDLVTLSALTDMEIFASLLSTGDSQSQTEKSFMLARLFIESAEVAEASAGSASLSYPGNLRLKALHLLLNTTLRTATLEWPEFVPTIDRLVVMMGDAQLPLQTYLLLMQHFERTGQFAKAEDDLFVLRELVPDDTAVTQHAISFYNRMLSQSDEALEKGNLPRPEVESALAQFRSNPSETVN